VADPRSPPVLGRSPAQRLPFPGVLGPSPTQRPLFLRVLGGSGTTASVPQRSRRKATADSRMTTALRISVLSFDRARDAACTPQLRDNATAARASGLRRVAYAQ